ncbi:histidinol dehydrogenase [Inquilinus sp. NPDC058860]|uniref:histidinol dehydrogenase n=1 Tax=Inquilinus sp. NPDC058860 TaxID=3346652 RepID=UPI00368A2F8F
MPLRLDARSPGFAEDFEAFVSARRGAHADVAGAVAAIVADTRARGDAALIDHTERFDRVRLTPETLRLSPEEIVAAKARVDAETLAALDLAARRIESFHARTELPSLSYVDEDGIGLGARWTPIDAVGIYVPGGLASYPSSVLMNAIPARVAGVGRIAMAVPAPDGVLNPLVLAAAERAGVTEIWRVGGAQAVAALAYGTASIRPVDKITGPGNAYVAEAKRQVFGAVGIDMIAGPSEILVVADAGNDPEWIAVDLLSQAEHDTHAQSVLITDDAAFADAVAAAVDRVLARLPKAEIAGASWRDQGGVIVVGSLDDAAALVDRLAPEHLELAVADPDRIADRVRHAGAIFLGRHAPEAVGDYVAGPNHVLPTARSARFASGLSVFDFVKRTTLVRCDAAGLARIGPAAVRLARAEGLEAHALSIAQRLKG